MAVEKEKEKCIDRAVFLCPCRYLTQYDCVTFFNFLASLRASERDVTHHSLWMFMDAADSLFVVRHFDTVYQSDYLLNVLFFCVFGSSHVRLMHCICFQHARERVFGSTERKSKKRKKDAECSK